ncbi:hypothetical protein GGD57_000729 [Rhizobium esperanzae]|uniref:Uncharacterized protein n=1 Tax=Rhizobium esperanzae TaxID=1967781 RepID=A0A7W6W3L9_9HYPH|nr:hypothetical protein [Rhizobium esperanzae]
MLSMRQPAGLPLYSTDKGAGVAKHPESCNLARENSDLKVNKSKNPGGTHLTFRVYGR